MTEGELKAWVDEWPLDVPAEVKAAVLALIAEKEAAVAKLVALRERWTTHLDEAVKAREAAEAKLAEEQAAGALVLTASAALSERAKAAEADARALRERIEALVDGLERLVGSLVATADRGQDQVLARGVGTQILTILSGAWEGPDCTPIRCTPERAALAAGRKP